MIRWPIERSWVVLSGKSAREQLHSTDLLGYRVCGMLGAAGLGKTYELSYLADLDLQRGLDVRCERLAVLGQTADSLASQLGKLAAGSREDTVIYLDAFDEVMIPVKTAGLIIERWVRDDLSANKPTLRISCRSAVWPPRVQTAIWKIYGEDTCVVAQLQPLSPSDVNRIASGRDLDADAFTVAVAAANAIVLSQQPLTLEMLLRVYKDQGSLPTSRRDLFAQGVMLLASERTDRLESGTAIDIPIADLLDAAERLACFSLLSGRDIVDLGDWPPSSSLGRLEIESLPGGARRLDSDVIRAVGRCGLCDSNHPRQFFFAHRQFAEYLAGRRVAGLLLHQARSLLGSGLGWQAGVAGPLRETAAFAAMESADIATWLAEDDPEVVGLSDVADVALRKRATLNLLSKLRRHELTDIEIIHGDKIELAGFQYDGAEQDLRPVLRERSSDGEDVLEGAIRLIESWNLVSMSEDLAALMLDGTAPLSARKAAGYALVKIGTPAAKRRIRPLMADRPDDPNFDLKGLALWCNWPEEMTVPELLTALTRARADNYHGAYDGFLFDLDRGGFDARGHAVVGLAWARQYASRREHYEPAARIAKRIAIASLDEIDQPEVADALADLIVEAAETYSDSPLTPPRPVDSWDSEEKVQEPPPILSERPNVRRKLLDTLAARSFEKFKLWHAAAGTPGLLAQEDFPWLLKRATSSAFSMEQRKNYAEMAWAISWMDSVPCIEAWLAVHNIEPVASRMPYPLCIELGSEEAVKAEKSYAEMKRLEGSSRSPRRKRVRPSPAERVEQALMLSETEDPCYFFNLCQELTLEEYTTHYGFERFLTKTPGWATATVDIRQRIVDSAKRLLSAESDEPERIRSVPLNTIHVAHMAALWLLMECEPAWLETLPESWWQRWAWYILRELHPNMMDEPEDPKVLLFRTLHARAMAEVRNEVEELAASTDPNTRNLLTSLLDIFNAVEDAELDAHLCDNLTAARVSDDRIGDVARFVLSRNSGRALCTCLPLIDPEAVEKSETAAISAAVVLLQTQTPEGWSNVFELLQRRPDLAPRVLADFAYKEHWPARRDITPSQPPRLTSQIGELVVLLLSAFPPESDPKHGRVGRIFGPDHAARRLRDQLISWLGGQKDLEAVEALRMLEQQFGEKYPWLRRPRAQAERSYRLSYWTPIPPRAVAEILTARDKRLIRSGSDALDGVVAAIKWYQDRLRHGSPSDLDDLWNRPRNVRPSPKEEERVSDKLCVAIRDYFRDYAVGAEREVQICRRLLSQSLGGASGSKVDVLCRVPATAVADGDPIVVPVEVKLSHNREARTGLRDQLVNRYMSELGTSLGVFVVAWMGAFDPDAGHQPLWDSLAAAQEELTEQARDTMVSSDGLDIRVVVIDASLPSAPRPAKRRKSTI